MYSTTFSNYAALKGRIATQSIVKNEKKWLQPNPGTFQAFLRCSALHSLCIVCPLCVCIIVVPLPQGENQFALKINKNNNNFLG
jgi:hypothetical protein